MLRIMISLARHDDLIKCMRLREELQKALDEIKTLKGILPICMYCKGIRDDDGYWTRLEEYITENTDAQLSHGICEKCMEERFPDKS